MSDFAEEDEWTVDGFIAECDRIANNPPAAPDGFELIECEATPRHWPIYAAYVEGQYPAPCFICERDDLDRQLRRVACQRQHRRWKSWRIWGRISSWLYVLGVIAACGTSYGCCEFCGIGVQHMAPRWRGKRPYVLGLSRETWTCLRRGHRYSQTYYGLCSICSPCPSCGSTDPGHEGDCGATS